MNADVRVTRPASVPESATVTSLRQRNRAQVLRHVIVTGRTSRARVAQETGLSLASVTKILAELIAEGLVAETGSVASRGGRPIVVLEPRSAGAYVVGADVGERGVAVELFDLTMRLVDREFRGGRAKESPELIAQDLDEAIAALAGRHPEVWSSVLGVGLGLPGLVENGVDGQVLYAQSQGWGPVPITSLISNPLPVFADNGANAQANAELWFGAARGVDHAVVALLGRGVGLGLVVDGVVQRGAVSSAGEWGHSKIERGGRLCRCGNRGCLEAYLGADAIFASWSAAGGSFEGSGWGALGQLLDADAAGESVAAGVVDELVLTIGASLGGLVNLTNPQRIVVGGWVGLRLMQSLALRIEREIRANSLDRPGSQFELLSSTFGGDTVALGAAIMPLEELLLNTRP